jgi:hypothetical protein
MGIIIVWTITDKNKNIYCSNVESFAGSSKFNFRAADSSKFNFRAARLLDQDQAKDSCILLTGNYAQCLKC